MGSQMQIVFGKYASQTKVLLGSMDVTEYVTNLEVTVEAGECRARVVMDCFSPDIQRVDAAPPIKAEKE